MKSLSDLIKPVFRVLNAVQGFTLILALIVFSWDLKDREEERIARGLALALDAHSVISEVSQRSESSTLLELANRRQMVALEALHQYSEANNEKFLAGLYAPGVPFYLTTNKYSSGCKKGKDVRRVVLKGAYLDRANLNKTLFKMADLSGAHLHFAKLKRADFYYACLKKADLRFANLKGAWLGKADLTGANLSFVDLTNAKLTDADLTDANLSDANLSNANFYKTTGLTQEQLDGACISSSESLPRNLPNGYEPPPVEKDCVDS